MPIPFRDQDDVDELGLAAFLHLDGDPAQTGLRGALFQINARGEPVEFTYNRVSTPNGFLWRSTDLRRAAAKRLTASLLATCSQVPRLILARAAETPGELFTADLHVQTPVGRLAATGGGRDRPPSTAAYSAGETPETLVLPDPAAQPRHRFWAGSPPPEQSPSRRLLRELLLRGLLLEPFERAALGLREIFGESEPASP
jgi:hypothetical protein